MKMGFLTMKHLKHMKLGDREDGEDENESAHKKQEDD